MRKRINITISHVRRVRTADTSHETPDFGFNNRRTARIIEVRINNEIGRNISIVIYRNSNDQDLGVGGVQVNFRASPFELEVKSIRAPS